MQKRSDGPLGSDELAKDAEEGGAMLRPEDAPGHTLPESEAAAEPSGARGPNPLGGTMLPPD